MFQLVDIWTETCEVGEYVELLRRIIAGMTKPKFALLGGVDAHSGADSLPTLVWKKDSEIEYDPFFDDARDEADADGDDDRALDLLQDELRNESGLAFELDRPMTAAPPGFAGFDDPNTCADDGELKNAGGALGALARRHHRAKISRLFLVVRKQHHIALMSVSKVCHIIAEIYAEYVRQNLNAAQKHGSVTIASDATALTAAGPRRNRQALMSRIGLELHTKRFDSL